jgi:amino acid adenylation domain-containing protein/non-ribosomal peptide synthase protein (TIGR01720 family)
MRNIETFYPLSPLQKGLLFHSVFAPESALYFQQLNCTITGDFDAEAWKQAWQMVVDRHPVLRTGFLWEGLKEPVQVVHRQAELPIVEEDWTAFDNGDQPLEAFLRADRRRGFDLAHPPLMRLALLRSAEQQYRFVWSHHHLILDGWSIQLLLKEIFTYYEALCQKLRPALSLPRPYRDYIGWLQRQNLDAAEQFWRAYLHGFTAPTVIAGPPTNGLLRQEVEAGDEHLEEYRALTEAETARLQAFARQQQLTLNTLMQGAWALLLARYGGAADVVFGATVSGRPAALQGVEQMLGLFINALPVRVKVSADREVVAWLRALQEQQVEARQYEYSPLMEVQRWAELDRGQTLFDSLLIFKSYPSDASAKSNRKGLEIDDVHTFERTNYPLCIALSMDRKLELVMTYERQRFDHETIRRLATQFLTLLNTIVAHPDWRVKELQRAAGEGFRLSPQQERLWSIGQRKNQPAYRAACVVQIQGDLQPEVLKQAIQKTVARHDVLRTSICYLPGMTIPLQLIGKTAKANIHERDLRNCDSQIQDAQITDRLMQAKHAEYDAEREAPLSVELLTLSSSRHVLLLSLPALCADATTLKNLVHEITRGYEACLRGEELSDEPVPYIVFSEWQNDLLESKETAVGREFWLRKDLSELSNLKLPFEGTVFGQAAFSIQAQKVEIATDITELIEAISGEHEVSIADFLLTSWQILLWRLTAQSDIVVGLAGDGRTDEELELALGLFEKYLPLECRLEARVRFTEALKLVAENCKQALRWQECFSWELTGAPTSDVTTARFLPFCFDYTESTQAFAAGGATFLIKEQYACTDRFKIKLSCERSEQKLSLDIHYDAALFPAESISGLAARLKTLMRSAVHKPQTAVGELEILDERERDQLLIEFNRTTQPCSSEKCLHELFEEQVERTPERVAVTHEGLRLNYRELNARANQVARHLRSLGVGPEVVVGIMMERSVEMVVGLLAILKAGGAYVPLDPEYPQERLAFMIEDAALPVLITQQRLLDALPTQYADSLSRFAQVLCLDSEWANLRGEEEHNPPIKSTPDNLAYVIYTSGSTGTPKGVRLPHRAICNHMRWMQSRFPLAATDRVLQKTPISFDASVWEFYAPLLNGAQLVMAPLGTHQDPAQLLRIVSEQKVTTLQVVPTMLRLLLAEPQWESGHDLRQVFCGGEALTRDLQQRFYERASGATLYNLYGPTEACIDATFWECERETTRDTVPIGRPIHNLQAYVLDQQMQPVPLGVAGELYLGGAGVARDYLRRPELTAENFVPDPYSPAAGARLYRTGDLVRYFKDGALEFLGRIDQQVKLRGFRVELGEIETVLAAYEPIKQCVVASYEDEDTKRLVAYVVTAGNGIVVSVGDLQQYLKPRLPDYMIPAALVTMEQLPLTPNGKIDRNALPLPERARPQRAFVAARNPLEETLTAIWAAVLKVELVGIHDNFFELGGDSILSLQIIARAHQAGLHLTPKQLFNFPEIAQLAEVVNLGVAEDVEQGLITGQLPLTPIQRLFFEQELPNPHHYNQSALFEVPPTLDAERMAQAVDHLLAHHDGLRLRFAREQTGWRQSYAEQEQSAVFSRVDLSGVVKAEQKSAIESAATNLQTSLSVTEGPLVRVAFIDLGAGQPGRLFIVIHHLAVDGVSWRILLDDLRTAYEQLTQGVAVKLPPKTTSYKRWSELLKDHAQSETLRQELNFWLARATREVGRLPVDYQGTNTEASARTVSLRLDEDETRALLQEVPAAYNTQINDVLLTALVQTFARSTGERRLLIDLEGHGREEIFEGVDLSRTVGWFTSVFPVLLELQARDVSGEALKSIKEQLRTIPNHGIGHGLLRYLAEDSQIEKRLGELPQAEVCFNYLGQWEPVPAENPSLAQAQESAGSPRSGDGQRSYLHDVSASVINGQLKMNWTYSKNIHNRTTIEGLAQSYRTYLRLLIEHCQSPDAGGFTSSDFPTANLSQKELDKLVAKIGRTAESRT